MLFSFSKRPVAGLALIAASLCAGSAPAQTMATNSASLNGGYARYNGQENRPIENYSNRDANGNMLIVDGIIQNGTTYSSSSGSGSASAYAGGVGNSGGSGYASAIGNNLSVVTQGNNNTVIVNSTQINNGNVYAGVQTGGGK